MSDEPIQPVDKLKEGTRVGQKHPRHPITMENTPEETIRRMRAFPERAAKFRELIRALREKEGNVG